jgi:alkanesulfonate monooxygenase
MEAARRLGAVAIEYPRPVAQYKEEGAPITGDLSRGIRVGIIARPTSERAWRVAHERFPPDRRGRITHELAMKVSDSQWHRQLSETAVAARSEDGPYWLVPFENYKTFCPYLVGDYETVAGELSRYVRAGCETIILDVPASPEEMEHVGAALRSVAASPV